MLTEEQQARYCQSVINSDEAPGAQHVRVISHGIDISTEPVHPLGAELLHADRRRLRLVAVRLPVVDELLPGCTTQGDRRVARRG